MKYFNRVAKIFVLLAIPLVAASGSTEWISSALKKSPTVAAYAKRIHGPWAFIVDEEKQDYTIVAVGEDRDDHFSRGLTAKVYRSGRVYILETTKEGDEWWRLDSR